MPEKRDVVVSIVAWHENYPPGIVVCRLQDRLGRDWRLALKQTYVSDVDLSETSVYPLPGSISCQVHARRFDEAGRAIAEIELDPPVTNLIADGVDCFEVWADRLIAHIGR